MKRLFMLVAAAVMLFASGCVTKYDDTPIWNEIDSINNRIEELEELCTTLNNNITSVQQIVKAIEDKDYVTSVTEIIRNGEVIGYTINFTKGESISIYNGEDGKDGVDGEDGKDGLNGADGEDGETPVIGVKQASDGKYYWTINGNWLLDNNGNKIPATGEDGKDGADGEDGRDGLNGEDGADGEDGKDGLNGKDGKDGVTPKLKIEDDYWYVSYDNGITWKLVGPATGVAGDSIFVSVTQDEHNVYFTLTDGTELVVPLATSNALYRLQSISYVPAYNDGKALVEFTSSAADSFVVMDFELAPEDVAAEIAEDWKNVLSMKAVNVATRAAELIDMPILSCEADDQGIITVKASGKNLGDNFFTGHQYMNARLEIADDSFNHKSEYVPMVTVNHASTDEPTIPVTPTIKNNQIIYTSIDENIVEPKSNTNFGATITSNVYENGQGIITFDKDVTKIPSDAFTNKSTLKSVILPNFVTEIGQYAFCNCIALKEVTIGDGILTVGYGAFSDCIELVSVKLGTDLEQISNYAFSGCIHLTSINFPDKLKYIYGNAFVNCDALTEISLPESLMSISGKAFASCDKLKTVNFSEGLETIGNEAFADCTKITSIVIPNSVTEIGQSAFRDCSGLEDLTIGNGTLTIGYGAFSDCIELASVKLGNKLESIENYAFSGCIHLTSINFPERLKYIYGNAFVNCDALTEISLPESLMSIGGNAFAYCDKLETVNFSEGLETIGNGAFTGCTKIASIVIPNSVTEIGQYAFEDCIALEEVTIGTGTMSLGYGVFSDCSRLATINCKPTTPPTLGGYAFSGIVSTYKIYVPKNSLSTYQTSWSNYKDHIVAGTF